MNTNFTIIQNTPEYIICIKPSGIDSEHEMPSLISEKTGKKADDIFCVHRLDKAVSGIMIFANNKSYAAYISKLIQDNKLIKEYYAVVSGEAVPSKGVMEDLLFKDNNRSKAFPVKRIRKGVKKAILEYETLSTAKVNNEIISLVKIRLHTGRYHQIRAQFSSRKMPLLGDRKYGSKEKRCGIALFSCSLTFPDFKNLQQIHYTAIPEMNFPWNIFPTEIYK